MTKREFLHDDAKTLAIHPVFSKNSQAKNVNPLPDEKF